MSGVPAMAAVLQHSQARGTTLLVAVSIAKYAYPDGTGAYPGIATIAKLAKVSERTVQRSIKRLVAAGELEVHPKEGPKGCNAYVLTSAVIDPRAALMGRR